MLGKHPTDVISENQGKGKGLASNHLFLLSFRKKKILPNETWGLGEVNYFTNLAHGSQKKPWPALQERLG